MTSRVVVAGPDHARWLGPRGAAELRRRRADGARVTLAELPSVPDASVDELATEAALCTADDVGRALAAVRRVLAPGGRLHVLEHIARVGMAGRLHVLANAVWSRLPGGCHVDRDVPAALRRAGFVVTDLERFTMPTTTAVLRPWIQGTAVVRTR